MPPPARSAEAFGGSRTWRTDYLSILKALKWGERKFIHRKCFISSKTYLYMFGAVLSGQNYIDAECIKLLHVSCNAN